MLIGYGALTGFLVPQVLVRSSWPHRAPALAVAAWHALTVSFALSVALAIYHLVAPDEHFHAGLVGLLHSCGLASTTDSSSLDSTDGLSLAAPLGLLVLLLGAFTFELGRARGARSKHRRVLDIVGRRSERLRATVVEHSLPAAYCLPGRCPRVVVSQGALDLLSAQQLDAVLEHERAHIAGRHHVAMAAAEAFFKVFRRLPLARHAKEQTTLLLEMIADDRALRRHAPEVLATAMYEMAAGKAPEGAFAAGGASALLRLRRVLTPQATPHPALWGSLAAVAVTVPLIPFLVACSPVIG
nr:M56 family metallopeptidase [Streptomyces fildesensis]